MAKLMTFTTKDKMKEKYWMAKQWCLENKEFVIAVAPAVIGGAVELLKMTVKKGYLNEEKRLKSNYIYDRENGHYYELCRKPQSSEWLKIDRMREVSDAPLGVILNDMKLLK